MTKRKLLSFAKGSTVDKAISKDVELVFDEPRKEFLTLILYALKLKNSIQLYTMIV